MKKKSRKSIIFTLDLYKKFSTKLTKIRSIEIGNYSLKRFLNGELYVRLKTSPAGMKGYILGSPMPPDTNLTSLTLLSHTLQKEKAQSLTLLAPYLPYSRQEKYETLLSMNTSWIARILEASGIKRIVTVDVHTPKLASVYHIPIISLSPASVYATEIKKLKLSSVCLVAPDSGALKRVKSVQKLLSKKVPIAYLKKERTGCIKHTALEGKIMPHAIIIDDILDTGSTLISCVQMLRFAGVKRIWIMVTHGLFTTDKWEKLKSDVEAIYTTNSTGHTPPKGIKQIDISPLFISYLKKN